MMAVRLLHIRSLIGFSLGFSSGPEYGSLVKASNCWCFNGHQWGGRMIDGQSGATKHCSFIQLPITQETHCASLLRPQMALRQHRDNASMREQPGNINVSSNSLIV